MKIRVFFILISILVSLTGIAHASRIALKNNHPVRYVVKPGDTLWGIANKFLKQPWQWKQIWRGNSHIKNPDRIYPGAELVLHYYNGHPYVSMERGGTMKLSPKIHSHPLNNAVPSVPLSSIKPFLTSSLVLPEEVIDNAPYIVAFGGKHITATVGNTIYVRGIKHPEQRTFSIYRKNGLYRDPATDAILGAAALHVGDAELTRPGEISKLLITTSKEEIKIGDRITPSDQATLHPYFLPQTPAHNVETQIISIFGSMGQAGPNQVVVLDHGENAGLRPGDVLGIYKRSRRISDPEFEDENIELPPEREGELMVFRTFPKVSFALIIRAKVPVHELDLVSNP